MTLIGHVFIFFLPFHSVNHTALFSSQNQHTHTHAHTLNTVQLINIKSPGNTRHVAAYGQFHAHARPRFSVWPTIRSRLCKHHRSGFYETVHSTCACRVCWIRVLLNYIQTTPGTSDVGAESASCCRLQQYHPVGRGRAKPLMPYRFGECTKSINPKWIGFTPPPPGRPAATRSTRPRATTYCPMQRTVDRFGRHCAFGVRACVPTSFAADLPAGRHKRCSNVPDDFTARLRHWTPPLPV